jgi:hypothetical protein
MDKIIDSLRETLIERLKNPLISTFFIAWLFSNGKIIFNLLTLDSKSKLTFANSLSFDINSDILIPALATITYLYLIPLFNYYHQKYFDLWISEKRFENKKSHIVNYYNSQETVNLAKVKSQESHLIKIIDKELEEWATQKNTLTKTINELNAKVTSKENELIQLDNQIKSEYEKHENEANKFKSSINSYKNALREINIEFGFVSSNLQSYAENISQNLNDEIKLRNYVSKLSEAIAKDSERINKALLKHENIIG